MKLELNRVEKPYVFQVENETGVVTTIDASDKIGGLNKGLRPMEMLAASLAGCAAIDVLAILEKKRISTEDFRIDIKGKRSADLPSVFEWINLNFNVDKEISVEVLSKTIELVLVRYCSVASSLNKNISINYTINEEQSHD